jgi:hypothetical protein
MTGKKSVFSISFLCAVFMASSAMALGIGAYIDAAGGESHRTVRSGSLEDTGGTLTTYGFRAGLVFDTCVACDDVFSYRVKIGGGLSKADLLTKINYNSFHLNQVFAFAAVKNDYIKFWIGPQIGFSYSRGSSDRIFYGTELPGAAFALLFPSTFTTPLSYITPGAYKERNKYSVYRADAGITFGVNLNLGDYVTLAFEAGVNYGYLTGRQDREVYWAGNFAVPFNRFKHDRVLEHGIEGYGSVAFMFRFVDTYQ